MSWYDEIIEESVNCKQCGDKYEARIASNMITIILNLWCMLTSKDRLLVTVMQFMVAVGILFLIRQIVVFYRRKNRA